MRRRNLEGQGEYTQPVGMFGMWKHELDIQRRAKKALHEAGFTRSTNARFRAALFSLVLIIGFIVALLLGAPEAVVGGSVALGAVLLGVQQFGSSRNEVSLDKFYDRLQVTNDRLEEYPETREMVGMRYGTDPDKGEVNEENFHRHMYVFRELDNLEYALAKYRIGFMSADNAQRSLRHFRSRCVVSAAFRILAHNQVYGIRHELHGQVQETQNHLEPGYDPQTKLVVCRIVRELNDPECQHLEVSGPT